MQKISTVQVLGSEIFKEQKLTIGVDLGDRWSFYCVLHEAVRTIAQQPEGDARRGLESCDPCNQAQPPSPGDCD